MSYEHPINWQYRESQRFGTSVNRNQQIGTISRYVRLCHASSVHVRTVIIIWNKCVHQVPKIQLFTFRAHHKKNSKTSWSFIRVTSNFLATKGSLRCFLNFMVCHRKCHFRMVSVTNHDLRWTVRECRSADAFNVGFFIFFNSRSWSGDSGTGVRVNLCEKIRL